MQNRRSGGIRGSLIPKTNIGILFMTSHTARLSRATAAIAHRCVCSTARLQWTLINIGKLCDEVAAEVGGGWWVDAWADNRPPQQPEWTSQAPPGHCHLSSSSSVALSHGTLRSPLKARDAS